MKNKYKLSAELEVHATRRAPRFPSKSKRILTYSDRSFDAVAQDHRRLSLKPRIADR
jgi:hypothetical protein